MIVQALYFLIECKPSPEKDDSQTTAVVASIVCSLVFLTIGVLLGVVGLYLVQRVRGRSSGPTSPLPLPSLHQSPMRRWVWQERPRVHKIFS